MMKVSTLEGTDTLLIAMHHFSNEQALLVDIEKEATDVDMEAKSITMLLALKRQILKLLKMFLIVFD